MWFIVFYTRYRSKISSDFCVTIWLALVFSGYQLYDHSELIIFA